MNKRDRTISFRLNDKEYEILNNNIEESGMNKTDYIISRCLDRNQLLDNKTLSRLCSIRREVDVIEEKLVRTGNIELEDLLGIKRELEKGWK